MTDREKKYLADIYFSIELIEGFVNGLSSFEEYRIDYKTKAAVERHLSIVGEAVNKLLKENNGIRLNNATQIISLRNRLVHSYDNIDDSIIWMIISRHLLPLKNEVGAKLSNP